MSDQELQDKLVFNDWDAVRRILQTSKPRTRSGRMSSQERAVRDYFGEAQFRELRELSTGASQRRKQLGNVILLPGIMGSHLSVVNNSGDEDHIWLNLWRIVKGDMERLRLEPDGETNSNGEQIRATGAIGWYYARALETLQAVPFPYDWRIDIRRTAERLKHFLDASLKNETLDPNREVHFVAHSMGGLVVRDFIRQFPDLWIQLKGRLVMLGTPNMGSFTAVQGLMGRNETANKLAIVDLFHNSGELGEIINTFFGLYQLCPDKSVNPEVYFANLWATYKSVLFDDYLQKVPDFHKDLFESREQTVDVTRMTYIAGIGFETPAELMGIAEGDIAFATTSDGDGTVTHKLGLLDGVTTYYTDTASHADLPNDRTVLSAVRELLTTGETRVLARQKPVVMKTRSVVVQAEADDDMRQVEVVAHRMRLDSGFRGMSAQLANAQPSVEPALVHSSERKLLRSLLGGSGGVDSNIEPPDNRTSTPTDTSAARRKPVPVDIRVIQGSIKNATAPAIVVGHYRDLPPLGAIGALNEALDDWIHLAHQNGMIGADLGQLFFIPVDRRKNLNLAVKSVIIAGMGQVNAFDRDDLRYLVMNVALGVVELGYRHVATVLMGTNLKRFTSYRSIRSILHGINDAIERSPRVSDLRLDIYEIYRENFVSANDSLELLTESQEIDDFVNLEIKFRPSHWRGSDPGPSAPTGSLPEEVTRLTIERTKDKFSLSALVANAAIPRRDVHVQDYIVNEIVQRLMTATDLNRQLQLGHLLYTMVMPEDFQSYVDTNQPLILQLDRDAAAIPWELVTYGGRGGKRNFGVDKRVTRQFNMLSAQAPGVGPPLNDEFKVIIIADPAEEPDLRLPGARMEGEQLVNFFEGLKDELSGRLKLTCISRIGHQECNIVDVLSLIANERFDLVHFAGHGTFDQFEDAKSGWVFGRKQNGELKILSAREVFRLRQVPRLVFANACFSSQLGNTAIDPAAQVPETNRYVAGLAEAFFQRGIENYLGSGWQVDDILATEFAKTFYREAILNRKHLSEALGIARKHVRSETESRRVADSTWGAYQFYGDGTAMMVQEVPTLRTNSARRYPSGGFAAAAADRSKGGKETVKKAKPQRALKRT